VVGAALDNLKETLEQAQARGGPRAAEAEIRLSQAAAAAPSDGALPPLGNSSIGGSSSSGATITAAGLRAGFVLPP